MSSATVPDRDSRGGAALPSPPTLYAVTIDTEEEWDWNSGWPSGPPSVSNVRELRFQEVIESSGAAVTYFADHAVLADADARETLLRIAGRPGVEIGMHIHPWNTPPLRAGGTTCARDSFVENLPEEEARAKLETVYAAFQACGLTPTAFRGGRYSSGPVVRQFLREKGFLADASAVAYTTWPDEGAPDYRRRDHLPRRIPPPGDGGGPLWDVPLTLGFTRRPWGLWRRAFGAAERTALGRLRLVGIAERLNLVRKVWLSFEDPRGRHMMQLLRRLRRERPPCVCFSLHSSSLLPGANGCYSATAADVERLYAQLAEVLGELAGWPEFRPATVSDIARRLEERHHESARNQPAR